MNNRLQPRRSVVTNRTGFAGPNFERASTKLRAVDVLDTPHPPRSSLLNWSGLPRARDRQFFTRLGGREGPRPCRSTDRARMRRVLPNYRDEHAFWTEQLDGLSDLALVANDGVPK